MADPISIIAIAGLAYMGKKLSTQKAEKYEIVSERVQPSIYIQEEVPNIAAPRPIGLDNLPILKLKQIILRISYPIQERVEKVFWKCVSVCSIMVV